MQKGDRVYGKKGTGLLDEGWGPGLEGGKTFIT